MMLLIRIGSRMIVTQVRITFFALTTNNKINEYRNEESSMQLEEMSIDEKIGQLFMVGVDGTAVNSDHIHLLKTYHVGGIYYKEHNVKHPKQVHRFSEKLQSYADVHHPLFIATKQNGGQLNTIQDKTTPGLAPQRLGHLKNRVYTKRFAHLMGHELKNMGIQMNLGP